MSQALQFLVLTMAGWLNRQQEDLIDYLREENRVLREQLGSRPLRLTDARRGRGRPTTPYEIAELVVRMALENPGADVQRSERLGGLLSYYYRKAA